MKLDVQVLHLDKLERTGMFSEHIHTRFDAKDRSP